MRCLFWLSSLLCVIACGQTAPAFPTWSPQVSGTTANLRGLSAVDAKVIWVSGSQGTVLRTSNGGETWSRVSPQGVGDIDFRDIEAFDERTAIAMSAGEGRQSRLYKTTDGGASWIAVRINPDQEGFWDAIAFWDPQHGILMGDPVKGRFTILTTQDGGVNWLARQGPKAEKEEAAFAASGTALTVRGGHEAWFVTGGVGGARVMHSVDGGESWDAVRTPVRPTQKSAGLYSIAFGKDGKHGVAVGGDYTKPNEGSGNIVVTEDGGKKWDVPTGSPLGYRSAVANQGDRWIAVGTSGSDESQARWTWQSFDQSAYNAIGFAASGEGWAVGPGGAIGRMPGRR